jgi:signal transduction histidine kinase
MFGAFFGYEGAFERTDGVAESVRRAVAVSTVDRPLSSVTRVALVLVALIGTAAYGASFVVGSISSVAWVWSTRVALAAGLSWPVFGLALLGARRTGGAWEWFDICLRTMTLGIAVLSFASVANLAVAATALSRGSSALVAVHLAFLLVADVSMAVYFTLKALRLGMPLSIAVVLWVGVLEERERVLKYAPFGLSVSKSGQCVRVAEVIRDEARWREEPVEVEAADWSYPRSLGLCDLRLVRATRVAPIDYRWRMGRTERLGSM